MGERLFPTAFDEMREDLQNQAKWLQETREVLEEERCAHAKTRERLESAEAALREYTGPDTRNPHIAESHFARYGGGNG